MWKIRGRRGGAKRVRLLLLCWLFLLLAMHLSRRGWQIYAAPTLIATKTVALQVDKNNNREAERGDTLRYTITITNSGDAASSDVSFTDRLAANTTLAPGSIQTTPLAQDDSGYSTVGNVLLAAPVAQSLLRNDRDPDGTGGLTVSAFTAASASGGAVTVAANGSFTYDPPPGFSGIDTFAYTVDDGEGNTVTATVNITVGQVVWFINNAAGGPGDGRLSAPFSTIADFSKSAAKAGDLIFIYQGMGAYSGALTLRNNQQLIGQGVGLALAPNLTIPAAARPTLANVTLATGNTVRGLNINTSSGSGLSGNNVGALTVNNVTVTSSGGSAVSLRGGSATMTVTLDSVTASGGVNGMTLIDNRGWVAINGGTIQNTTGHAIRLINTIGPLDFMLKNSTIANTPAGYHGLHLELLNSGALGAVMVQNNTIADNHGIGIRAQIEGTSTLGTLDISGNTFTNNTNGIELVTTGSATVTFDIHNNATISGDRTQVYLAANDAQHNDGVGPTMTGHIRNNTMTLNPALDGFAVWAIKSGDGHVTVNIADNQITGFGDSGIAVESLGGMGDVHATIVNNRASSTSATAVAGVYLRNGDGSSGETSLLCVNLKRNRMNAGAGTDYLLERANRDTTIFQIQGISPSPATPAEAITFVAATDAAPPATAGVAPGDYVNATCHTVNFAAWPGAFVARAQDARGAAAQGMVAVPQPDRRHAGAGRAFPLWRSVMGAAAGRLGLALHRLFVVQPVYADGESVELTLGALRAGQSFTLSFDVTIGNSFATPELCNQATVSGDNFSSVLTDDPAAAGSRDPTCHPIVLPDTTPPDTNIDSTPPAISTSADAAFTFSGKDNKTLPANLTFACKLDGGSFTPCTSPQNYHQLTDGLHTFQVRAMDEMGNVDASPASFTWNINPIVPVADLTVTKVNNVDDHALPGQSWIWTIHVTNLGDDAAHFAAGQPLLIDNLPADNLTYGTPVLVSSTGITDTANLDCTLADNDLICAAVTGAVTLAAHTGAFTVELSVSATVAGDYNNPRPGGHCRVDPNAVLGELNEGNNNCDNAVIVGAPDLTLTKRHTGNFLLGQRDAGYTIMVQNIGSGPTAGIVTVTDALPAGLTATALTGNGWSCSLTPLRCTRSDALAVGSSYPQLTLTVEVTGDAPATVLNQATVTVEHDTDPANNTAIDATQIVPVNTLLFLPMVTRE